MEEQRLNVVIKDDGTVQVETLSGFKGQSCSKESEQLLVAIGGTKIEERKKPEFYDDGDDPVSVFNS